MTKKWKDKTRGGYDYIIHTENGKGLYPVIGQIFWGGKWVVSSWKKSGHFYDSSDESSRDLVPLVDLCEFYEKVLSASPCATTEMMYNNARQWFIDHPEELK